MSYLRGLGGALVLALSSLPLGARIALAEPRMPTHVACVGDSITAGVGASTGDKSYPALLQGLFGSTVKVTNFGHSGATMLSDGFGDLPYEDQSEYMGASDFVRNAGASAVVDVIIMLGANDSKPFNWAPDAKPKNDQQYLKDYRAMVEHFQALTPKPVVYLALPLATGTAPCCEISGTVIADEELPLIKQLAAEKKLPIIDLNTPTSAHPEYFTDGVHPNDGGYVVVAQVMHDGLLRVPTVSLTAPTAGASLGATSPIALTADASGGTVAIDSVEFFQGSTSLGKATSSPFTVSWNASPGSYGLTAKALDSTLASATSASVSITVTPVDSAGGVSGSAGAGGASVSAGGANIGGATNVAGATASGGVAGSAAGAGASGPGGSSSAPSNGSDSGSCGCVLARSARDRLPGSAFLSVLGLCVIARRRRPARRARGSARTC